MAIVRKSFSQTTSSANYTAALDILYDPTSTAASQVVELQLWLKKTDKNYKRMQHTWSVSFYIDQDAASYTQTLPDDTAESGVSAAGHLHMVKDNWYKWGKSRYCTVNNNGGSHKFSVTFECLGTIPRNSNGAILSDSITFPTYVNPTPSTPTPIIPPAPKGESAIFNSTTREVEYVWRAADCSYVLVWSNWYDSAGNFVKKDGQNGGYVHITVNGVRRRTLYNSDVTQHLVKEVIPDNVVRVEWQMENVSTTGHGTRAPAQALNVEHKLWVRVNDVTFKKAIPWVRLPDGTWIRTTI